ncbi:MAG: type II toxin-antitoxin system RelE/ParE family toxin [Betaproteobacteria bacterium]|nr:type II toxin-antitoxin system RelE/ParE family toxin [Betaproteobacteria bacterium]
MPTWRRRRQGVARAGRDRCGGAGNLFRRSARRSRTFIEFLLAPSPETAGAARGQIRGAVSVLASHPQIGRRADVHRRELVITHGTTGYLALYRYDARLDLVRVLRIRHRREAGYRD